MHDQVLEVELETIVKQHMQSELGLDVNLGGPDFNSSVIITQPRSFTFSSSGTKKFLLIPWSSPNSQTELCLLINFHVVVFVCLVLVFIASCIQIE